MYTAVQDNLDISLSEVKEWLRLNDVKLTTVTEDVNLDSNVFPLEAVEGIKKNQYITINDIVYLVENVDYVNNQVMVLIPAMEVITAGTPVYFHPHDRILMNLLDSVKAEADHYLNNPFLSDGGVLDIPPEVRRWVLKKVALDYDRPEAGVSRVVVDEGGAKTYAEDVYADINHLRLIPL